MEQNGSQKWDPTALPIEGLCKGQERVRNGEGDGSTRKRPGSVSVFIMSSWSSSKKGAHVGERDEENTEFPCGIFTSGQSRTKDILA